MTTANPPPSDEAGQWRWRYACELPMLEEWGAVWAAIPPDAQAGIRALHEKYPYGCVGHDEGQFCCIDFLDGSANQTYQDEIRKAGKDKS
jgi:hypothetical protein